MMEFATLTIYDQKTRKGKRGEGFFCIELGLNRAEAYQLTEIRDAEPHGPYPPQGTVLEAWRETEVWVNSEGLGSQYEVRRLWYKAKRDDKVRWKEMAQRLRGWGFVPVHEALEATK